MGLFDFVKGIGKKIRHPQNLSQLRQLQLLQQNLLHKKSQTSFWGILKSDRFIGEL